MPAALAGFFMSDVVMQSTGQAAAHLPQPVQFGSSSWWFQIRYGNVRARFGSCFFSKG